MKIKPVAAASTFQEPSISPSPKNSTKNFDASFVQTFRDCAVPETRTWIVFKDDYDGKCTGGQCHYFQLSDDKKSLHLILKGPDTLLDGAQRIIEHRTEMENADFLVVPKIAKTTTKIRYRSFAFFRETRATFGFFRETRATFGGLECRFTNHCRLNEEQKRLVQAAIDKVNASLFSTTPQSSHF